MPRHLKHSKTITGFKCVQHLGLLLLTSPLGDKHTIINQEPASNKNDTGDSQSKNFNSRYIPDNLNSLGYRNLFHPKVEELITNFFYLEDLAEHGKFYVISIQFSTKDEGFLRPRVYVNFKDGSHIPKGVKARLGIFALEKRLRRLISECEGYTVAEYLRRFRPRQPVPPPSQKKERQKLRKLERKNKRNRLADFSDFYYQSGNIDFDLDSEMSSLDDELENELSSTIRTRLPFVKSRMRPLSVQTAFTPDEFDGIVDRSFGVATAVYHFLRRVEMAKRLTDINKKSFLVYEALSLTRVLMGHLYHHQVFESVFTDAFMFFCKDSVELVGSLTFQTGFSGITKFALFAISYSFMRETSSWSMRRSWFENATTLYFKKGGVSDQASFLELTFGFFKWLLETGSQCFTERSLDPFFRTAENYSSWYDDSTRLLREAPSVGVDLDINEFLAELEKSIENGKRILDTLRAERSPLVPAITRLVNDLEELSYSESLYDKVRASKPSPFFLGIYGAPKTGKTFFLDELASVFFQHIGEEYSEKFKYVKSSTDKYESGMKTYHKLLVVDDLGTMSAKAASEQASAGPRMIMEVANSTIGASNQADLKDKGRIFARFSAVFATSNDPQFGHAGILNNPAAYLRRIRYRVSLQLKPEFRRDGHNFIDLEKVARANTSDIHTFNVVEFVLQSGSVDDSIRQVGNKIEDPQNASVSIQERIIMSNANQHEFFAWYASAIDEHLRSTKGAQDHLDNLREATLCRICNMMSTRCSCDKLEPQSGRLSDFLKGVRNRVVRSSVRPARFVGSKIRKALIDFAAKGVTFGALFKALSKNVSKSLSSLFVQKMLLKCISVYSVVKLSTLASEVKTAETGHDGPPIKLALAPQSESYRSWVSRLKREGKTAPVDVYFNTSRTPPYVLERKTSSSDFKAMLNRIQRNFITISDGVNVAVALGLYDDVVVTVSHFGSCKKGPKRVTFVRNGHQTEHFVRPEDVILEDEGLDLLVFHTRTLQFRSILDFIPLDWNYYPNINECEFVHPTVSGHSGLNLSQLLTTDGTGKLVSKYQTVIPSRNGWCGGVYVTMASNRRPMIVSLHCLGDYKDGTGVSQPLSQGMLGVGVNSYGNKIAAPLKQNIHLNGLAQQESSPITGVFHPKSYARHRLTFPDCFKPLGATTYDRMRPKTEYVESPLHGKIPPSVKVLPDFYIGWKDGKYQNLYNDGIDQLCDKRAHYPEDLLIEAFWIVNKRYMRLFDAVPKGHPLDEHTSLNGLDGVRFIDPVDRKTGRGLPKRGPKIPIIVGEPGSRQYTAEARESVLFVAKHLAMHSNPGIFADLFAKDEVKKPNKAVRLVSALPYPYNDLMRRVTLPVMKVIQDNPILTGIAIGMDAESYEWKWLFQKHIARKYHVLYDFSTFDKSHDASLLSAAHRLMYNMMAKHYPVDATVEGYAWYKVATGGFALANNPIYNVDGTLYQSNGTLASGMFHTAMVNSLCQELILQMMWIVYRRERGFKGHELAKNTDTFKLFNANTMYGDDGFVSSDAPGFNLPFFVKTAAKWGLTITDPDKRAPTQVSFPVEEWSFLKRSFVPRVIDGDFVVGAPLEFQSILKALNYYKPNEFPESETMFQLVEQQIYALSTLWTEESEALDILLRELMKELYDIDNLKTRKACFQQKLRKMVRPSQVNLSNLAQRARKHPAKFEADWYGRELVIPREYNFEDLSKSVTDHQK